MAKVDSKVSVQLLNKLLANETVLLFQTLNYHWNVEGKDFYEIHLLFDKQYNLLFADLDKIAERVRALGGIALGSMNSMLEQATLKEDSKQPEITIMVSNLLKQYERLIDEIKGDRTTLENSHDYATCKLLEDLLEQHEKTAWMLRSIITK